MEVEDEGGGNVEDRAGDGVGVQADFEGGSKGEEDADGGTNRPSVGEGDDFPFSSLSLLLALRLLVDGLTFLLAIFTLDMATGLFSLGIGFESREKLKAEPIEIENLKALPWLTSAWERAKHWRANVEFSSLDSTAAILSLYF